MFNLILFDVHENFLFSLTPEGKDWVHRRKRNISKKKKKKKKRLKTFRRLAWDVPNL